MGRNYVDHVKEGAAVRNTDLKLPEAPQFFTKATHTVIGPGCGCSPGSDKVTRRMDYEVELAIVIGHGGRDIPAEAAFDHIFGYSIANDVTARDLQKRHDQWFKGKSLDTTLPFGPWIIDREEIGRSCDARAVDGDQWRGTSACPRLADDLRHSYHHRLAVRGTHTGAGDVIATGTPSGVGFAMNPPQYLKGGDVMVARIDRIGELRNRVVAV